MKVPAGVTIVAAIAPQFGEQTAATQFYVLRGAPAVTQSGITDPTASTDTAGAPDIALSFTPRATARFQALTARVARRGERLGGGPSRLYQHLAIVVDNRLIATPEINDDEYPDGILERSTEITGDLDRTSAREIAAILRFGVLPTDLRSR